MQVFFGLNTFPKYFAGSVAAIGVFDGLHRAHMKIIENVVQRSIDLKTYPMLITFEPHPKIIRGELSDIGGILTSPKEKMRLLKHSGLEAILFLKSDEELLDMLPESFVKNVLMGHIRLKELVVGFDYKFGKDRRGDVYDLKRYSKKYGFGLTVVNPIKEANFMIKSSQIRKYLLSGEVEKANKLLGRYYSLTGFVVHGEGRGREIGYPTANIKLPYSYKLVPRTGTYFTKVYLRGIYKYGLCNIGYRPTFEGSELSIEVYIFDPEEPELYGMELDLFFIKRLRDEKKFDSVGQLREQIEKDKRECLKIIENLRDEMEVGIYGSI